MKKLDEFQQKAADVLNNAVVSAGAGSGKTTVLSSRAVNLVTKHHIKIDELLVLTFTKKATVEMKSRIFASLSEAALSGNLEAKTAIRQFDRSHIQTLDSYCAEIARQGAHFYGITPSFSSDKEKAEETVKMRALPFLLKYRDDRAIQSLTRTMDFDRIADEFLVKPILENSTVSCPIDFLGDLENQIAELPNAWKTACTVVEARISEMKKIFQEGDFKMSSKFALALDTALSSFLNLEMPILSESEIKSSDSSRLDEYILSFKDFCAISLPGGKISGTLLELKRSLVALFDEIDTLLSISSAVSSFEISSAAAHLLSLFQDEVNREKRSSGILTFRDVADLALKTLLEHPEIRLIQKRKFRAIMIDEFQDNNELQRDMLFLLSEKMERNEKSVCTESALDGEKLFFVGDEKQSIYRFRGANVSVFRQLKKTLKGADGRGNLELNMNYRSKPELIAFFNTIFGATPYPPNTVRSDASVFYTDGAIPDYEAQYVNVEIPKLKMETADFQKRRAHVSLFKDEKSKSENEDNLKAIENEAAFVASKISEMISKGTYSAGDFAILLKSTTHQAVFERMLLLHGLPYSTEIFKGFFSDGPVNDIVSYLSLCAYTSEADNAFFELLCSPFVNLSFEEASEVVAAKIALEKQKSKEASAESGEWKKIKLPPFLKEFSKTLSLEAKNRYESAADEFFRVFEKSQIEPIANVVSYLWYSLGYRYETLWNRTVEMYSPLYDLIFELARQSDEKSENVADFVDKINEYRDEQKKVEDIDIPFEARDCVKIMTIHKSKGLEFKVVFVSAISGRGVTDSNSSSVFISKKWGAVINTPKGSIFNAIKSRGRFSKSKTANYFYDCEKAENDAKAAAELRRLMYVAFTRAEDELFITGSFDGSPETTREGSKIISSDTFLPGKLGEKMENSEDCFKSPKTIYHLLQPFLSRYVVDEKASEHAPFDFELIKEIARNEVGKSENKTYRKNCTEEKRALLEKLSAEYDKAEKISTKKNRSIYISPSLLHAADEETHRWRAKGGAVYKIDEILKGISSEDSEEEGADDERKRFGSNNFGNIAHAFMEALFNDDKKEPNLNTEDTSLLSEEQLEKVCEICADLRNGFALSEIGKRAAASFWKRAEFAFRARVHTKNGENILRGSMDLVFQESDGSYTIIDYKTTSIIKNAVYAAQLACYRRALSQMLGVDESKISCHIYYLRLKKDEDITPLCEKISIESLDLFPTSEL